MAHRIYTYNIDYKSKDNFPHYLGEWNYAIPELLIPLFSGNPRNRGTLLYFDKEEGISRLRTFYNLLGDTYQLHHQEKYEAAISKMFGFLENLPFNTLMMDATDVFNMNDERHRDQAKDWVEEIVEKTKFYNLAMSSRDINLLNDIVLKSGYASFLEILQKDWIDYGLGYWNEDAYKESSAEIFEQDDLWGVKDSKGNVLVPPTYENIYEFTADGIAVVQKDGRYGYLNDNGVEVVPCQYHDACDAFRIDGQLYGEALQDSQWGVLHIDSGKWSIPAQHDEQAKLYGGLFNVKRSGNYCLLNVKNEQVIGEDSEFPFEFEYPDLILTRDGGTSKRRYYNLDGVYLGAYLEDVLHPISAGYYWVSPNKYQQKISILSPNGTTLAEEIDRIVVLPDYNSIAYIKQKRWYLYDVQQEQDRLAGHEIEKVNIDALCNYMPDVFVIVEGGAYGVYHALQDRWLVPISQQHRKIEHCHLELLRITLVDGMQYFDQKMKVLSDKYDFICQPMDYSSQLLCLFSNDKMWVLDNNRQLCEVKDGQMGALHENAHNLRKEDQRYFLDYYKQWTQRMGNGFETYFDDDTLYQKGRAHAKAGDVRSAIQHYTIGAQRGNARMAFELGSIYTTDPEFEDIPLGVQHYEEAALQDYPNAWNDIGYLYQNGIGYSQDTARAIIAYEKAATLGSGLALCNLGDLYFYGNHVDQDYDRALEYYKKSEKKGYSSLENMSEIYYKKEDYTTLQRYLRKDYEETYAHIYYGILYDHGYGVKHNAKKAIDFYEKSMAYARYFYALERLLFYYKTHPTYADQTKYEQWSTFAKEHDMELNEEKRNEEID
ncbi:SEL1-like repeat protein [Sphingobacterium sp. SYP-B4668]|uniref:SEL1-like repeat protein n=1 Tax=Sphingobacterium sp. SYP-B4668 TaxID=2996035 RepID=UPI0022DD691F|nr:SEL1-like repeat protein [Sphingobacterium sp. SYP-B4668]